MRYIITSALASLVATAAWAEGPTVVTDIPPVHSLVAMVMGEVGQPVLLLDQGGDAHDFQLRPSQAAAIADADLVVWIGPEMSPWLDHVLDGGGTQAAVLGLLAAEGTFRQDYGAAGDHEGHDHADEAAHGHGEDAHDHSAEKDAAHDHAEEAHDHGAEHDHAAEAAGEHAGHDHSGTDPHAWLDPHNAEAWVGLIAAELSRLDPANAAAYAANAAAAAERIEALEAEVAATLAPVKDRPFVVFHEAYAYFAGHFGLTIAGAVAEGDAASPGAARLRDLQAVAQDRALCIFPEANHDPALSAQMAEATGVRLGGVLDPEGSALTPGPDLYPALLTGLAGTLADCLSRG